MSKSPYALLPLTQLASFESAARHLSFKEAAEELGVTPSAISHQVRALEDQIFVNLFDRSRRQIQLTDAGQKLFEQLFLSFSSIAETVQEVQKEGEQDTITVATLGEQTEIWMGSHLAQFLRLNDGLRASHEPDPAKRDRAYPEHLVMTYGIGDELDYEAIELFRDEIIPVASPEFANRYRALNLPSLARLPLVPFSSNDPYWVTWPDWFKALGYLGDINYGKKSNGFAQALAQARAGQGVALAWRSLIERDLRQRQLVVLGDHSLPAPQPYYLHTRGREKITQAARRMQDWLVSNTA